MKPHLTRHATVAIALAAVVVSGACGSEDESTQSASTQDTSSQESGSGDGTGSDGADGADSDQKYPDILEVEVERNDEQSASFSVTVSSPYDTPERYADGWRVLDQDGEVLGEHTLGHDHADEQPFTRRQSDVDIPEGTTELTIEGRDQENGYGGDTVTLDW
ncbi:MAG: hypothetical protein WBG57_12110 [Ornithinimicrobium sp.]